MILHPSQWLSKEDIDLIRQDANTAESKGQLSPAQLVMTADSIGSVSAIDIDTDVAPVQ